jgi:hypothetical protein
MIGELQDVNMSQKGPMSTGMEMLLQILQRITFQENITDYTEVTLEYTEVSQLFFTPNTV